MSAQVLQLSRNLGRHLQMQAKAEQGNKHLRVLKDAAGHKFAQKIYSGYVSQEDFSKFPQFCQELDALLYKYSGETEQESEDIQTDKPPQGGSEVPDETEDTRDTF